MAQAEIVVVDEESYDPDDPELRDLPVVTLTEEFLLENGVDPVTARFDRLVSEGKLPGDIIEHPIELSEEDEFG